MPQFVPVIDGDTLGGLLEWLMALKDVKSFLDILLGIVNDAFGIVKPFTTIGGKS